MTRPNPINNSAANPPHVLARSTDAHSRFNGIRHQSPTRRAWLATAVGWGVASAGTLAWWPNTAAAQPAPRFIDLAGAPVNQRAVIDALKTQSSFARGTRTRRINLEPMFNETPVAPGEPAEKTVAANEALEVKTESPRLSFDQITFGFDSARIDEAAVPVLSEIGTALASSELQGLRFLIEGHTDARGGLRHNMRLSSRRADAVKLYLTSRHGLDAKRLVTSGRGPTDLHDPKNPESGVNRRVVLMAFDGEKVSS